MKVAFHGDELFFLVGIRERRRAWRLNFVPLAVDLGERMDVVGKRVAVGNAHFLARAEGHHVRGVSTIILIEGDRGGGNRTGSRGAAGDVDNNVTQRFSRTGEKSVRKERLAGVEFLAQGFLGKVHALEFGQGAGDGDLAGDFRSRSASVQGRTSREQEKACKNGENRFHPRKSLLSLGSNDA